MSSKHDEPLPREWVVVRVGDVCNQRNEIVHPSGKGKYRFVGLEHVNSGETRIHNHDSDVNVKSSKFRFYAGDLLYGKLRPYLDKAVLTGFEGICSTDLLVLTAQNKKTLAEFLVYVIHSNEFIRHAISTTSGTNHPRTSWKAISKFKFGLPPRPEQYHIAEILTTADTAIQKVGDAIAKTERLKRGVMQELLTKGIGHKEFKDSEVGRIPRGWEVTTLIAECVVGTGGTPSRKHPEYFGGTVPWIKTTEVNYNTIMETGECITELGLQNSNAKIYPAGTLIIAMYGQGVTRGKCAILGMDAAMNQACAAVTPKNDNTTHVKYLHYWCQFKYDQIRNLGQGANQSNLNLSVVSSIRFPRPPLPEQHHIAEILSTVDKKLELETKRKEKLERIKKGLMNDLLTGEKRVKP